VGIHVAQHAWPDIDVALRAGAIAVLPIGAAAKEHGYHLPLDTDYRQALWLGEQAASLDTVVWPVLSYGYYPVFVDYPGSVSLGRETFSAVVREVLGGIARAGARSIAILNTGISTISPLQEVVGEGQPGCAVSLVNVYAGERFAAAIRAVEQQPFGGHADEIETSIMLALAPTTVQMQRAVPQSTPIQRGMFNRSDPAAANYSPSGANGDPTLATVEKGQRLLQAMRDDVFEQLLKLRGAC
jgi:creatinine amidohydrolase